MKPIQFPTSERRPLRSALEFSPTLESFLRLTSGKARSFTYGSRGVLGQYVDEGTLYEIEIRPIGPAPEPKEIA